MSEQSDHDIRTQPSSLSCSSRLSLQQTFHPHFEVLRTFQQHWDRRRGGVHAFVPKSAWIFAALAFCSRLQRRPTTSSRPRTLGLSLAAMLLIILFGTVFAAVHHAEVIARRISEPYGTLLLTLSVTIIEVALIATMMLGEQEVPTLARDTVLAVVMIVCNGLVGVCIFIGGLHYREQDVQVSGASLYLSVLFTMATIT